MRIRVAVHSLVLAGVVLGFVALRGGAAPAPVPAPGDGDCVECRCKMIDAFAEVNDGRVNKNGVVWAKKNAKGEYEAAQNASGRNTQLKDDQKGAAFVVMTTKCPSPDAERFVTKGKGKILQVRQQVEPVCKVKNSGKGEEYNTFVEASRPGKVDPKREAPWDQFTCQDKPKATPKNTTKTKDHKPSPK